MKAIKPKIIPRAVFKKIYSKVPRLCVDLVISDRRGELLGYRLISPWKNLWCLPGGTVLFGESLQEAAVRIAKAETGLKVKVIKYLGYMEFLEEVKLAKRHSVSLAFLCHPVSGRLQDSWQGKRLTFFKRPPAGTVPQHKKLLQS